MATTTTTSKVTDFIERIQKPELMAIQRIQNVLLIELQNYAFKNDFVQIMPLLTSPITDPLNHSVYPAELKYEENNFKLCASMIFHKQMALMSESMKRILIMSPNIRLEKSSVKVSENHLIEFSQHDIELRDATIEDVMKYIEELLSHVMSSIKEICKDELALLGRTLPDFTAPFPRYSSAELIEKYGENFEEVISKESPVPVFVTNFKREFYDKEDQERPGTYLNFDLIYPEGYGEALSGAERENEYVQIVKRMKELDMDLAPFENYLELAKSGKIPRTAGSGIGIQRLVKFICGKRNIADVCLFDRSINSDFLF